MLPTIPSRYPEFVSDQVLTAANLNDMFDYLDEQERMTRTNLIGIGIVCGLEIRPSPQGDALTITKGCGVTSSGYLVTMPTTTYAFYSDEYSAERERYYDRFVDLATKKQRFPLYELAEAGSTAAKIPLTSAFLKDKVVLLFVELLEARNKNCDPDSCDDKGASVTVTFRPLLVDVKNAAGLLGTDKQTGFSLPGPKCADWPVVRMPRYDVPSTSLPNTALILGNFLSPLNQGFLGVVESTLTKMYQAMRPLVEDSIPLNPFSGLKSSFAFLTDGTIGLQQFIHAEYYYDLMSDLLLAYDELRLVCNSALAVCCPDENLFPRHLLLGLALKPGKEYRHGFFPSPAVCCGRNYVDELRGLLLRIARMLASARIPVSADAVGRKQLPLRITPSTLGPEPLSVKAIPYYYDVLDGVPPLFELWNGRKAQLGAGRTNLSYHAASYNTSDDWVRTPLQYDLEPYNFLRIEGHIGRHWRSALTQIIELRRRNRLPFEVVALNGDFRSLISVIRSGIANLSSALAERPEDWRKFLCLFSDLETQYDAHAAELRCLIAKVSQFLHELPATRPGMLAAAVPAAAAAPDGTSFMSELLLSRQPAFAVTEGTFGEVFSKWYATLKDQPYSSAESMLHAFALAATTEQPVTPTLLMYYLEKIHESLPKGIIDLNVDQLADAMDDAVMVATELLHRAADINSTEFPQIAEYRMHLDAVMRLCKAQLFRELYRSLLHRYMLYIQSLTFAMYAFLHSGVQHKAGVPMGGTFIIVYHDAETVRRAINANVAESTRRGFARNTEAAARSGFAADRAMTEASGIGTMAAFASAVSGTEKISAVKDASSIMLDALLGSLRKEDAATEKALLELAAEIPDGTVIADFYLPYVCASDCPPMHFICLPSEETAEPTIAIDGKTFCAADSTAYLVHVAPAGGQAVSDAGGVVTQADGSVVFIPAQATMGQAEPRTVTLTYTVNGQSASTQVQLFHPPVADFSFAPTPTAPTAVVFTNGSKFASSFKWDFGDGNTSTEAQPLHDYKTGGAFVVTLTAFNEPCPPSTVTKTVTLETPTGEARCLELGPLVEAFTRLDATITDTFIEQFPPYETAKAIFLGQVPNLLPLPQPDQSLKLHDMLPVALIVEWMSILHERIMQLKRGRTPHLTLFRILHDVLMYYACVQKEDIDGQPIPTLDAFTKELKSILTPWATDAPPFNNTEKPAIAELAQDIEQELQKITSAQPAKKQYIKMLKALLKAVQAIP
jgi:PKD repeat protein